MSYVILDVIFVGVALVVAATAVLKLRRRPQNRRSGRRGAASAAMITMVSTAVVLGILTAVFDNLMIGVGLFDYTGSMLLGPRIGLAPVEDFAYPLGAALLLPGLWVLLGRSPEGRR